MGQRTIALVVVLAIAMPSRVSSARTPDEIQALLDQRASAVRAKDKAGFMATLDNSDQDFVARQSRWFEGMTLLPVSDYRLDLDLEEAPEFTRQRERDLYKAPVIVAAVEERFRLGDYDLEPAILDHALTFVYRTDRWSVAGDSSLEDLGIITDHSLWEFGPIQVLTSEHFLLIFHPQQAAIADELISVAEASLGLVVKAWKTDWHMQVPILVPSDEREVTEMIGDSFDISNFVAFATAALDRDSPTGWELVGNRVIINPPRFLSGSAARRQEILAHELVHVATRRTSGPFVPTFVEEGIAQLAEERSLSFLNARVRAGKFDRKLPEDFEFLTGDASDIFNSYQEALSALTFIRETFGLDKLETFYEAAGKPRVEAGTSRYHLDRALQRTLSTTLVDFESKWASFAAARAR